MLKFNDKWIWDFWFTKNNDEYHVFYLQAPKSLIDERKRHHNATIGHAVSTDLINWDVLPNAISPSQDGSWDDLATWTGSVIKKDDTWFMFYTGVNKKESGLIQRIGFATSKDLITWHKYENNPVLEADSQWYEMLDLDSWHDHAWRDPCIIESEGSYYAFITARVNYGLPDERGVIALASSLDLISWEVLPPVSKPGNFGQLEVPQYIKVDDDHLLVFSTAIETTSKNRMKSISSPEIKTGTFYLKSKSKLGHYILPKQNLIYGDKEGSLYSGKIIDRNGELHLIAFHNYNREGNFLGYLADPIPLDKKIF